MNCGTSVLTVLTLLFSARVAGQALVAFLGISWLPPMEAWHSGILPYSILLPAQVVILTIQTTINWQVHRGTGFVASVGPSAGRALRLFAYFYALTMLARWLITRTHAIPIAFHWVLAAYLFTLGRLCARPLVPPSNRPTAL